MDTKCLFFFFLEFRFNKIRFVYSTDNDIFFKVARKECGNQRLAQNYIPGPLVFFFCNSLSFNNFQGALKIFDA